MDIVTTLPRANQLTRADLDAMPDDGRRYELIDGVIVVSASPSTRHQDIVKCLAMLLHDACPRELKVMIAPFDVALTASRVFEPDVLIARRADLTEKDLPGPPLLAVEVLSPSTRWLDLGAKKQGLEDAGCPSYWVIDPGGGRIPPSLIAWELLDGGYVEGGRATGGEAWETARPVPVRSFRTTCSTTDGRVSPVTAGRSAAPD